MAAKTRKKKPTRKKSSSRKKSPQKLSLFASLKNRLFKPSKSKTKPPKSNLLHLTQRVIAAISVLIIIYSLPYPSRSQQQPDSTNSATIKDLPVAFDDPPPVPLREHHTPEPAITAKGAYVLDIDSNTPLFKKNPERQLMPASTTKIMTALIALDTYSLDKVVTITQEDGSIGQTMKLSSGENISIESLLYGTLVASGNDAALALALAYPQNGYSGFVNAMNRKAQSMHLQNTHYSNVSGVETPEHYTSAQDLAQLAKHALTNPVFAHIVQTKQITLSDNTGEFTHQLTNTNQLLGTVEGVYGVKTGWTENAGECLVTAIKRDGHHIIIVVLGSLDRFQDSHDLIDWTFANHTWINPRDIDLIQ